MSQQEIVPGGPTKKEAEELNKPKAKSLVPKLGVWDKISLVLTGLGIGALGNTAIEAQNQTQKPPQATPDQRTPNLPPEGVHLSPPPDSSAPSMFKIFLPIVPKQAKEEPPLRFLEFGNLETEKVLFMNRSNTRFIKRGDEILYGNLFWRKDNYAPFPNIKRVIVFFESLKQLQNESWILYNFPHNTAFHPGNNYIGPSERRWTRKPDGSLEFHISIPSPKQGVDLELAKQLISGGITLNVNASLWSNEEGVQQGLDRFGNGAGITGSQKAKDFQEHPIATRNAEGLQITAFSVVFQ